MTLEQQAAELARELQSCVVELHGISKRYAECGLDEDGAKALILAVLTRVADQAKEECAKILRGAASNPILTSQFGIFSETARCVLEDCAEELGPLRAGAEGGRVDGGKDGGANRCSLCAYGRYHFD